MSFENDASFDVIVVGAAQRLLQAHPDANLALLERDHCIGGVWSERRIYPSFWSQWTHGIAEFSDMPMERPPAEDLMHDLFRAKYTTKYLEDYVDSKSHAGKTLRDRVQFNTEVQSIEKIDEKWQFRCANTVDGTQRTMISSKVMMANGQASLPNVPNFPGKGNFQGKIIHSIDFGQSDVIKDKSIKHIAVIGAGKSAADMVYEAVKAGKTVSWIIRKTGNGSLGAAAFAPIDLPTPYRNGVEASQARIMASLQPSYLISEGSWWSYFLHSTRIGTMLVSKVFSLLDKAVRDYAGYKERRSDKGFEKLEYDNDIIWQNGTAGGCHFSDFWSLVAEKVYVHRGNVKFLSGRELYLDDENETHFPCDAILCGTGWQSGLGVFDNTTLKDLGLPFPKDVESQEESSKWAKLEAEADEEVLKRFVMLRNPPKHYHKYEDRTPYRLYHTLAPVHDDSILFMNHIVAGAKLFAAEAQAIWAVAYWDKAIKLPSVAEREKDIAHMVAWNRRRYLSNGELGHFAAFDSVPYVDRLLDEIGVTAHRKKGWLANMFAPIRPADLGKVWQEYLTSQQK
ncbi:flavin-binding monooxygenase-like protein-like protein [Aaosphaeria arxii CBS 175.79]|uniref:Flavin-binding monooxygenase-like protein-like protein n=1 Tax=Aaosphaeria arxii CBS 175.79 TaxID=1450172 RepID=A0A6A5XUQ2_9PLEO|nr:flavin-binding monooxygenase-like protein-like protein [Aaosphaeria arxii CBS 175.79]KAF2016942.1 flavin-binding monooxygenase-like protein-like protein [Aaosphaeria arxii CBS 175.79]